ncbi:MAG: hypothetical protein GQ526_02255 [Ardenticatenales bacterium]|nr:hypothetical protein [Ardenticatenales bacterium]
MQPHSTSCPRCGAAYGIYCTDCNADVPPGAATCPECGAQFEDHDGPPATLPAAPPAARNESLFDGRCPSCDLALDLEDGYCTECGQSLCPACGAAVDEDDDQCPQCHTALFFGCPLCRQQLLAATSICPQCDAFFARRCSQCNHIILGAPASCPSCDQPLSYHQRPAGHRLILSSHIACQTCGSSFDPLITPCPACRTRVCPGCLRKLYPDDTGCPSCGAGLPTHQFTPCPGCGEILEIGTMQCSSCEQDICSECGAAVAGDACPDCGAQFESYCPHCETPLEASQQKCPRCGLDFDD